MCKIIASEVRMPGLEFLLLLWGLLFNLDKMKIMTPNL